ncbi:TetR/AcrR family transcriptional regulator [Virgibacillus sp. AGTR]|uniref:TetR/AcrR family transcriptional regulator n=1 Tax=Virgibacillus TaxID=84406 RepID=UPI00040E0FAA|nr:MULTISPECIES: TetR/AcrR family transcriptional regulator [Bacillaceae]MCC2249807.1 TetR/AcrR family transcriptional regulator [Virgibacillus sp. AGTR]MDY7044307.1 TetR/AcrR family transcriptional regulator [Virgibacillus sp. M23]QRZ19194.1 TetR/AcrR family transcriptional regulator [Virgibacillus sp. AGTR]WBX81136.1 TetR/AcrR family transcriptional regulator [Virgibacillus salarius]
MSHKTKQSLIQATIDLIMENGLERLTINKVIKKAESSKGSFYYYFSNIDDLMKETFLYALEHSLIDFSYNPDKPFKENILSFGRYLIKMSTEKSPEHAIMFLWISKSYQDESYRRQFQEMRKQIIEENSVSKDFQKVFQVDVEWLYFIDVVIIGFLVHCLLHDDEDILLSIWKQLTNPIVYASRV